MGYYDQECFVVDCGRGGRKKNKKKGETCKTYFYKIKFELQESAGEITLFTTLSSYVRRFHKIWDPSYIKRKSSTLNALIETFHAKRGIFYFLVFILFFSTKFVFINISPL